MVLVSQGTGRVDRCQHWFLWFVLILTGMFTTGHASELLSSADVMEGGKWSVSVYGRTAKMEPVLSISNASSVLVPLSSGNSTIFSAQNTDVTLEQESESAVVAVKFRPKNGLTYRVKAGQIQSFDLEFSSGSHTNKLEATDGGLVWGLGAEWSVSPGSIVSPAITLDGSWTRTSVDLDRFQSPGVVSATQNRFEQDELQLALNLSRRWKQLEPFGGLKVSRLISRLRDDGTKESLRGYHDGWAPFLGLQWEFFDGESLLIEASFVDDESISAGLNLKF
jgi:hypothetical protein